MNWVENISEAIEYIEKNITEKLTIEDIARHACVSPFYFQKGFTMLCGFTVGEYIRNRRLSLAASDLLSTNAKIIDIALKYGYDSPDSFTKAFTRFHNVTPTDVRRNEATIKSYAPLTISFALKGAYILDYKIVEKDSFTVIGVSKNFKYENGAKEVPKFWQEHFTSEKSKIVSGSYGINMDQNSIEDEFEYMIADNYNPMSDIPEGFVTKIIPKHTWVVFPNKGLPSKTMPELNKIIFTEWLPNCKDYEIAEGYNIEMYSDVTEYENGVNNKDYYYEIWIPIKKK